MATSSQLSRELKLIRERLDSIEEALSEEMSMDDRKALREALHEHRQGKTVPFRQSKKHN
jgi:predicted  nucleic acid-binding Zn-ribbon protein